ncbi:hypothetical protein C6H64_07535 [Photorhabdus luminescens]|uniref:Uncharacterized protein n=1 Tax=Photorhabdus bodei TaxID=2029681 RepID=A0AAW6BDP1_9GAMM|nr:MULTISPECIES: hypothetical protein [Photorhabdus]MCC8457250.1 hypothetical protein [Photorhabdus aegyptia]MDB6371447.1 hypothetical protein [Photorhabdus bodei]PQQ31140.1 hypothetical protein C6H64_07535 [Photorhabdus luminescens]
MKITCNHCKQPVEKMNLKQAEVIQTPEFGEWVVDLILVCPHCSQQYGVSVSTWDLQPLETTHG